MGPDIKDGDTVIVDKARIPLNGNLVGVFLNGEASVKRYKEMAGGTSGLRTVMANINPRTSILSEWL
jgi:SOS-response transcriptional repressor LexA